MFDTSSLVDLIQFETLTCEQNKKHDQLIIQIQIIIIRCAF